MRFSVARGAINLGTKVWIDQSHKSLLCSLRLLVSNVDNLLAGASGVQEGFEVYQQSKELMAKGGFNLRKWNSNSSVLLQHIKNEEGDVVQSKTEDRGGKSANGRRRGILYQV